jgi:hypothetical protein
VLGEERLKRRRLGVDVDVDDDPLGGCNGERHHPDAESLGGHGEQVPERGLHRRVAQHPRLVPDRATDGHLQGSFFNKSDWPTHGSS